MKNKYIFLGDSLTFGYGVKPKDNWVNKLDSKYSFNIYNKGINGNTTTDMLFRFQEDVIDLNPDTLFIMGGTNDLLSNRTVDSIASNIELLIKDALLNNIKILIGIPPNIIPEVANKLFMPCDNYDYCKNSLPILKALLITICNKYDLKYIDFYSITSNTDKLYNLYLDGIHFNSNGHELLFKEAEKYFII